MPTGGQISLVVAAVLLFLAGGAISMARLWSKWPPARLVAKSFLYFGLLATLTATVWHSLARHSWIPLEDNFDALLWLAVCLTLFVLYVQRSKPFGGLDWFILPIVVLLLIAATSVGILQPQPYDLRGVWSWVHRAGSYGGAAAFAIAGAAGAMYLFAHHRLRSHRLAPAVPNFGSLERLEDLTQHSVTIGFALLTLGALTGFVLMKVDHVSTSTTKIVLSCAVWLTYALVLHTPMNPSFRGRRAALLSVFGFVLMLGTILVVLVTPQT